MAAGVLRIVTACVIAVAPPLVLAAWPAPSPQDHSHHGPHADHVPAAVVRRAETAVPPGVGTSAWDQSLPPWPAGGRVLNVGEGRPFRELSRALSEAADGDRIVLHGGVHAGPVVISRAVWVEGQAGAAIDGGGKGRVISISAPGARVTGIRVRSSGDSLDSEDAGIYVFDAPGAVVAGCELSESQFGIVVKNSRGALVAGNTVVGRFGDLSLNGDGIRVWHSDGAVVHANTVRYTREILVEQSKDTHVTANAIVDGRLGLHLMRAPGAVLKGNLLAGNSTGIFVMYGADTQVEQNRVTGSRGPSGYGVALKDADNARIASNWLMANRVGIYLDSSPRAPDLPNEISGNLVSYNDIAVAISPATRGNRFHKNDFLENSQQVEVTGGGDLHGNLWTAGGRGNYWSDYAGYDADRDGTGDVPYTPARLFEGWMDRHPDLRWFWLTPAATAADLAARAFPLAAPAPVLTDERPAMAPADRRDSLWSSSRR